MMSILRKTFILFWRIWFYIVIGLPIIVMFPVLLILTSREQWYSTFFVVARYWARFVLFAMGFHPKVTRDIQVDRNKSYMVVANHTSMTDIMLMLISVNNPFVFVGKKELAKIPIFGFFYKRTCILVDRSSQRSRKAVFDRANARLKNGTSICIFPEGGVPDDLDVVLDDFKDGAFRLAIDHQIPILPLTFFDNKKRFPFHFFKGSPGKMRAHIHPTIPTKGLTQSDKRALNEKTRAIILESLQKGPQK